MARLLDTTQAGQQQDPSYQPQTGTTVQYQDAPAWATGAAPPTPTELGQTNSFAEDARRAASAQGGGLIPAAQASDTGGVTPQPSSTGGILDTIGKAGVAVGRSILEPFANANEIFWRGMFSPEISQQAENAVTANAKTIDILEKRKRTMEKGTIDYAKLQGEIAQLHSQNEDIVTGARANIPSDRQAIGAATTIGLTVAPFVSGALGLAAPGTFGAKGAINSSGLGQAISGATAAPVVGQAGYWKQAFSRAALNTGPLLAAYSGGDAAMSDASAGEIAKRMALSYMVGVGGSLAASGLKLKLSPRNTAMRAGVNPKAVDAAAQYPEEAKASANLEPQDRTQMGRDATQLGNETLDYNWKQGERKLAQQFQGQTLQLDDKTLGYIDRVAENDPQFLDNIAGTNYHGPMNVNEAIDLNTQVNSVLTRTGENNPDFKIAQYLHRLTRDQTLQAFGGEHGSLDTFLKNYGEAKTMLDGLSQYFGERGKFGEVTLQSQATAENNLTRLWRTDKDAFVRGIQWLADYTKQAELPAQFAGPELYNAESSITPAMRDFGSLQNSRSISEGRGLWGDVKHIIYKVYDGLTSSQWAARNSVTLSNWIQSLGQSPAAQLVEQQGARAVPQVLNKFIGKAPPRTQ